MDDDSRAARARCRAAWQGALLTEQTAAQLPTPEVRFLLAEPPHLCG